MVRLTLTGSSDCASATDEMVVTITGYPAVDAGPDITLCHGEVLHITGAEAENVATVSWVTSGTGALTNAATLRPSYTPAPTESGIVRFILTGTGMGGCGDVTVKDTTFVSIVKPLIVKARDDIRILSGRTTILSVEVEDGSGFYSYLWTPENKVYTSNTNRTETMPLTENTTFEVTVTDNVTGCSAKDNVTVTVVDDIDELITIYNGVSPNGDGANDVWLIDGIELFPDNEAMIFNRWGDEIKKFKAYNNITVAWDATNKQDKPVPDGTYYYVLKIEDIKTYTGWIQVKSGF
jgi:gliding motility-associated-like protein